VASCAALLAVSVWLPWLTTGVAGGGHATGIGGTVGSLQLPPRFGPGEAITLLASLLLVAGAMAGRQISPRWAAGAALLISLGIAGLVAWYHHLNVAGEVAAGYGWYAGAVLAGLAVLMSLWSLADVLGRR